MKLYAPEYYKNFKCIADKCTHNCCIGWEIDIDAKTLDKYNKNNCSYGKAIRDSIDTDETPHFRLSENHNCPHLNGKGLCNIIIELGEDYLCDICREHPRFYNNTVRGIEVGIGMACEEACRLILESDNYANIIEIDDFSEDIPSPAEYDVLAQRDLIYGILSDKSLNYKSKLKKISETYGISLSDISDDEWREIINSLEYLDKSHQELFLSFSFATFMPKEFEKYAERVLAYFLYRHCTEADNENEFRASLGFCLFCEKLLASLATHKKGISPLDFYDLARIISEELEYSESNTESIKFEFSF